MVPWVRLKQINNSVLMFGVQNLIPNGRAPANINILQTQFEDKCPAAVEVASILSSANLCLTSHRVEANQKPLL